MNNQGRLNGQGCVGLKEKVFHLLKEPCLLIEVRWGGVEDWMPIGLGNEIWLNG
jgi:hypothetical protein